MPAFKLPVRSWDSLLVRSHPTLRARASATLPERFQLVAHSDSLVGQTGYKLGQAWAWADKTVLRNPAAKKEHRHHNLLRGNSANRVQANHFRKTSTHITKACAASLPFLSRVGVRGPGRLPRV